MTKKEYIERYGAEWYESHKLKVRERYHNDTEFRENQNIKKRERQKTLYNEDENYRLNQRLNVTIYRYCRRGEESKIENYELAKTDNFKGWDIHHRLELTLDGEYAHNREELIRLNMYYNRPYYELIFLPRSVHTKLHKKIKYREIY